MAKVNETLVNVIQGYIDEIETLLGSGMLVWDTETLSPVKMQQPVIEATNSNFYVKLDDVENLLTDIKANQTNSTQKVKITDGTDDADVIPCNGNKGLVTLSPGHVSTVNSTSTTLAGDATFTGIAEEILNYGVIQVMVKASHASATNGLKVEFSANGTDWDSSDEYTISAGVGKVFSFQCAAKYFRVSYTNGSTQQTYFRLHTTIKPYYVKPSSHRVADNITNQDDAELVKAVLAAEMPSGTFTPINATAGGNLKISLEEFESAFETKPLPVKIIISDEFGNRAEALGDNYYQGALLTLDVEHHEVHCGDSFRLIRKVDLGNGASDNILIIVPNETGTELTQKKYHLTVDIDTESETDYSMFEAPTVTSNGTPISIYNRNRNSLLATSLTAFHTPTTTGDGTLIDGDHWGAGKDSGGSTRSRLEWVLKNNTSYLLRITNSTTSNNFISWKIDHYIHPGI